MGFQCRCSSLTGSFRPSATLSQWARMDEPVPRPWCSGKRWNSPTRTHSLIYAEGALAETFLDDDSRGMFNNASDYHSRYPEGRPAAFWCAPRVENGSGLEAVRQRLATVVAREAAEKAKTLRRTGMVVGDPVLTTP
jgi:hypothetical protein